MFNVIVILRGIITQGEYKMLELGWNLFIANFHLQEGKKVCECVWWGCWGVGGV